MGKRELGLTGIGVVLRAAAHDPLLETVELPKPPLDVQRMVKLWVKPSINPCRQRKGKSGEIARRGPW